MLQTLLKNNCGVKQNHFSLLNDHHTLICRWNSSFTESSLWQIQVPRPNLPLIRPSMPPAVWWGPVFCGGTSPHEAKSCWFLSRRTSEAHLYTWRWKQSNATCKKECSSKKTSVSDRRGCVCSDRTGRTPRPAPSEFRRISASVWLCLESHRPSGPEPPRWRHPIPAENAHSF